MFGDVFMPNTTCSSILAWNIFDAAEGRDDVCDEPIERHTDMSRPKPPHFSENVETTSGKYRGRGLANGIIDRYSRHLLQGL